MDSKARRTGFGHVAGRLGMCGVFSDILSPAGRLGEVGKGSSCGGSGECIFGLRTISTAMGGERHGPPAENDGAFAANARDVPRVSNSILCVRPFHVELARHVFKLLNFVMSR
jgi:hypothetical protein